MTRKHREAWENNRQTAKQARKVKGFWCEHCDRNIVQPGQRCRCCGQKDSDRKSKKPLPDGVDFIK